uniref:Uncharacterized protein n=1 Tax=Globisporangium ultimum (strain ATCC 200006 / CBS 805.95 / DAOM BR144) TaxID=431595 RepID=K3XDD1_GLOUD
MAPTKKETPHFQSSKDSSTRGQSPVETEVIEYDFCDDSGESNQCQESAITVVDAHGTEAGEQLTAQNSKSLSAVDVDIHGASDHESLKGGCLAMGLRDAEPLRETQVQTKAIWTDDYRPWKTENVKRRESAITVANVRGAEVGEQSNVRESKSLSAVDVDIHGASDHESLKGGCLAMGLRDAEPLRETQVQTKAIWTDDYRPWKTENVKRRESAITVANVRGAEVGEQSNVRESKSLSAVDVDIHGASDHESLKGGCLAMGLRDAEPLRETQVHTNAIWMNDYHPWMAGYVEDWYKYSLYDTTGISEPSPDVFDASTHRDELSLTLFRYDRDRYYLNLFFQMRFFTTKKPDAQLSPGRLLQAWNAFVEAYLNPVSFWARYEKARETFVKYLFIGIKME